MADGGLAADLGRPAGRGVRGGLSSTTDRFIRTLGWRVAAERDLAALSPETRAILDAYAAGVNAWLDGQSRHPRPGVPRRPASRPSRGRMLDTLAWGKVQAWNLGGNMIARSSGILADARLGDPARTDELFPAYREDAPVITPTGLPGSGGAGRTWTGCPRAAGVDRDRRPADDSPPDRPGRGRRLARRRRPRPEPPADWPGSTPPTASPRTTGSARTTGSSAPAMSSTGGALLANDPHLGISMPSIWFINGLHCRTVVGRLPVSTSPASRFPGVPGVVLGHNARIAWGATNVDPDVQDLVIETVDPADPNALPRPDGASTPFTSATNRSRCPAASRSTSRSARRSTARSSTTSTSG